MYENYFNLRESPFNLTPDPRFFFINASVQEAFATLCHGIEQRKGIIIITGEAGTGKTTLLKRFIQNSPSRVHTACILDPHVTFGELLQCAFGAFGLSACSADRVTMVQQLSRYLVNELERDGIVTLLLDEAQDLDDAMLDELGLLSDLQKGGERLLQVVLVGQPLLDARLSSPSFDLRQRVMLRSKLRALESEEIRSYIEYRLRVAGYSGETIFRTPAIERITAYSSGIPRLVNVICDNALLIACATAQRHVGVEIIDEVADDLQFAILPAQGVPWALKEPTLPAARSATVPVDDRILTVIGEIADDRAEDSSRLDITNRPPIVPQARTDLSKPPKIKGTGLMLGFAILALIIVGVIAAQQRSVSFEPMSANLTRVTQVIAPLPGRIYRVFMAREESADRDDIIRYTDDERIEIPLPRRQTPALVPANQSRLPTARERDSIASFDASSTPKLVTPQTRSKNVRPGDNEQVNTVSTHRALIEYLVVDDSFVRKQPTSEADILTTLHAGTRIQLVDRRGDYMQIRSRERGIAEGYVHKEDAFFERLK
jgi:general secretion pathway protein A